MHPSPSGTARSKCTANDRANDATNTPHDDDAREIKWSLVVVGSHGDVGKTTSINSRSTNATNDTSDDQCSHVRRSTAKHAADFEEYNTAKEHQFDVKYAVCFSPIKSQCD